LTSWEKKFSGRKTQSDLLNHSFCDIQEKSLVSVFCFRNMWKALANLIYTWKKKTKHKTSDYPSLLKGNLVELKSTNQ